MKLFKNTKIFIAGHNGMVGSSLFKSLKRIGMGKIISISRKKLNLLDQKKVDKFIKIKKPDIIINCAGRVGGIYANSNYPVEFLNENIFIQLNLINSAYKNKIKHFINLGSSCIYPKSYNIPIKEKFLLTNSLEKTNEAYALAKIVGLKSCEFYNKEYNTNYLTLIPCKLYGPNYNIHEKNSHFIPSLIKKFIEAKIKKKNSVEIWGSGSPKREVMHVDDLSNIIIFILKKKITNCERLKKIIKKSSLINVGTGQEYTIKNFAKIINKITGANKVLKFNKRYPDGTKRKKLDLTYIKRLGWRPKIRLESGLKNTIKWYQSNYLK